MTGAAIVAELLRADPTITGTISPAASIRISRMADDVELTAILVRTVSVVDRQPLKRVGLVRRNDRVSVAVRAANYRDQVAAIAAIRACLLGKTGNIGGGLNVSIQPAGTGPDLNGPGNSFEQTQDVRVSFDAPA